MADFLEEKRKEIQARLKELKPAVEEYNILLAADEALGGLGNGDAGRRPRRRRRPRRARADARLPAPAPSAGAPRAAGRAPRRHCNWSRERPGITIPEMAEAMGIQQNYLYRVMPGPGRKGQGHEVRPRLAPARRRVSPEYSRGRAWPRPRAPPGAR